MNASEQVVHDRYKAEGYEVLRDGWPDFLMFRDDEAVFVEVKAGSDKVNARQTRMHRALEALGFTVRIERLEERDLHGSDAHLGVSPFGRHEVGDACHLGHTVYSNGRCNVCPNGGSPAI